MKITIVGGGLAGALSSCFLAKEFPDATVEMIHSPKVPTLGIGESITPHLPGILAGLGVDEKKFMRETNAVFKYANNMEDWTDTQDGPNINRAFYWNNKHNTDYSWHNICKTRSEDVRTTDVWLDVYRSGAAPDLNVYQHNSPAYQYAKHLKMPFTDNGKYLLPAIANYAYHIDAEKCAPWIIENVCKPYGVKETNAHVKEINTNKNGITNVVLENNTVVTSDLWLDCTGLSRLLISKLTTDLIQSKANVMNSAWVCPISYEDKDAEFTNYTRSIRKEIGWQFKITLDERIGTGIIFSDKYFSDDEALEYFKNEIGDRNLRAPRLLKWTPGRLKTPNVGNCFAIGMAAGFVDPLEANAVVSIIASIKRFTWMHQRNLDKDYYNKKINAYFQDIADFIAVHYTLSPKGDNHFWNDMRRIGKELNHKDLVKEKYYSDTTCMNNITGFVTCFPDTNWLDIANNWIKDLDDWPARSTPKQQEEYIKNTRNDKLLHEIQSSNNKKSINEFMKMYNNIEEHNKGLDTWPLNYFTKMFSKEGWESHVGKPKTESKI